MNTPAEQLQIYYELALAVGRNLNLYEMLKSSLNAYLKKLNCGTGIVYKVQPAVNSEFKAEMIFSIPYALVTKNKYHEIERLVPDSFSKKELIEFRNKLPYRGRCEENCFFHIMNLGEFGFLVLIRNESFLDDDVIKTLEEINSRFGEAGIACIKSEALEESELRYRHQQELLPEMLCETNLQGVLTYATAYALEKMGYSLAELNGEIKIINLFPPSDRVRLMENFNYALTHEKSPSNEYTLLKKDGTTFPVLVYSNRLKKNKKVYGLISIIVDITDFKEHEKKILEMNKERDKLYSVIAHDIRSPFSSISLTISSIASGILKPGTEEFREIISYLDKTASETSTLLDNLLTYTRLQGGSIPLVPKMSNLYPVIMGCIQLLKADADKKNISVDVEIPIESPAFFEEVSMQAVFRNLIFNAIKFTPDRGTISISVKPESDFVRISIKDTGIGISEEVVKKIFIDDEHYTSRGTNSEQGSGLGSFIVKDFVEKNNGRIDVTSLLGTGTEVTVYLPLRNS